MIIVDLETSGVDFCRCGIWQIGAMDFKTKEEFFGECRIDDDDIIEQEALRVIGKTEKYLRAGKESQKDLLNRFFKWCKKSNTKNFMCENPNFDVSFLEIKAKKYDLKFPFHHRAFDLHSASCLKYLQVHGKFKIKDNKSNLGLSNTLKFCGMKDNRKFHNALEDVRLTAECFSRIFFGKNLLKEYGKYPVPEYLKLRKTY